MSAAEFCIIDKNVCFSKSENCFSTSTLVTIGSSEPTIPFLSVKKWPDWWCPNPPGTNQPRNVGLGVPGSLIGAMKKWQQNLNPRVLRRFMTHMYLKTQIPPPCRNITKNTGGRFAMDLYKKCPRPFSSWCFFGISKLLPRTSWVFFVQALFIRAVFPSSKGNNSSFFSWFGSHKNSDFFVRKIRFPRNSRYPFTGEVRCGFFRWMGFCSYFSGVNPGFRTRRNWRTLKELRDVLVWQPSCVLYGCSLHLPINLVKVSTCDFFWGSTEY